MVPLLTASNPAELQRAAIEQLEHASSVAVARALIAQDFLLQKI